MTDLSKATQAVLDEMGWEDDRNAYPHPGVMWQLAEDVARAVMPHLLRVGADQADATENADPPTTLAIVTRVTVRNLASNRLDVILNRSDLTPNLDITGRLHVTAHRGEDGHLTRLTIDWQADDNAPEPR